MLNYICFYCFLNAEIDLVDRGRMGLITRIAMEPQRHSIQQRAADPGRMGQQLPRIDEEIDSIGRALPHHRHGRVWN